MHDEPDLRTEMRRGFSLLREELIEVRGGVTGLRGGLSEVRSDVAELRGDMTEALGGLAELRADFTILRGDFARIEERLAGIDARGRRDGVLLEELRDTMQVLAEAHALLDQRVERYREENDAAHREILTLLRTSYRDLDRRVTRLESDPGEAAPPD